MRIAIAGASGLVGQALAKTLASSGGHVVRLVRGGTRGPDEIRWNPAAGDLAPGALDGVHAVINLAGENIGQGRWSETRRRAILQSRIDATRTLVAGIRESSPRPAVLINASAVGCYGDRGDEVVTEASPLGRGFLADVCRAWEAEAQAASALGVRVVLLRLGMVLASRGGALAKMIPVFRLGVGGRLGSGRQWMSWVHLDDVAQVFALAVRDTSLEGPVNLVAPAAVTNAAFTEELARAAHRWAVFPAPAWGLRLAFGKMADEALLASTRAVPAKLLERGYAFQFPTIGPALRDCAGRPLDGRKSQSPR